MMKIYEQFHGEIDRRNIGKELRCIVKNEKNNFKLLTGYGSTCGVSISKQAVIKSLNKMKQEGLIKGYLPGNIKHMVVDNKSIYYEDKIKYYNLIKNDEDYGNEGIIFVFIK